MQPNRVAAGAFCAALSLCTLPASATPDKTAGMALMSAVVNSTGDLIHGAGAVSAMRLVPGGYHVRFRRPLSFSGCFCIATTLVPGLATTGTVIPAPNTIQVNTFDTDGVTADNGFTLIVFCKE